MMDHAYVSRFDSLVNVAIKFAILVGISATTSLIAPVCIYVFNIRPSIACSTDMLNNMLCLFGQFNVGNNGYKKMLGKIHSPIANRIIEKRKSSQILSHQTSF